MNHMECLLGATDGREVPLANGELAAALENAGCAWREGGNSADIRFIEHAQDHLLEARKLLKKARWGHSLSVQENVKHKFRFVSKAADDLCRAFDCCKKGNLPDTGESLDDAKRHLRKALEL